mmetsp:Transcript_14780/g.55923  ORF Transcript_14780/g.55923 Transcript_14780/m.55923 type:complete len:364 (+) Transcript_14780:180-1271(+)
MTLRDDGRPGQIKDLLPPVRLHRMRTRVQSDHFAIADTEVRAEPSGEAADARGLLRCRGVEVGETESCAFDSFGVLEGACLEIEVLDHLRGTLDVIGMELAPKRREQVVVPLLLLEVGGQTRYVDIKLVLHLVLKVLPLMQRAQVLVVLGAAILLERDGRQVHRGMGGHHDAVLFKMLVPRDQDAIEHGFAQEEVPHPLAYDHVNLLRQLKLFHRCLDDGHDAFQLVRLHQSLRVLGHVRILHGIHFPCTGLRGPHGKDTSSCSNVQHDLPAKMSSVVHDGRAVCMHPTGIREHLLLVVQIRVGAEIVRIVGSFLCVILAHSGNSQLRLVQIHVRALALRHGELAPQLLRRNVEISDWETLCP